MEGEEKKEDKRKGTAGDEAGRKEEVGNGK